MIIFYDQDTWPSASSFSVNQSGPIRFSDENLPRNQNGIVVFFIEPFKDRLTLLVIKNGGWWVGGGWGGVWGVGGGLGVGGDWKLLDITPEAYRVVYHLFQ